VLLRLNCDIIVPYNVVSASIALCIQPFAAATTRPRGRVVAELDWLRSVTLKMVHIVQDRARQTKVSFNF
jgi:hypothetical protein